MVDMDRAAGVCSGGSDGGCHICTEFVGAFHLVTDLTHNMPLLTTSRNLTNFGWWQRKKMHPLFLCFISCRGTGDIRFLHTGDVRHIWSEGRLSASPDDAGLGCDNNERWVYGRGARGSSEALLWWSRVACLSPLPRDKNHVQWGLRETTREINRWEIKRWDSG